MGIFLSFVSLLIINRDFIRFTAQDEQRKFREARKGRRLLLMITRSLILLLLAVALSGPHFMKEQLVDADPHLTLLIDNSSSMEVMETAAILPLGSDLGEFINLEEVNFGETDETAIGDALLSKLSVNENILLVTDGQSNAGRRLDEILTFARTMNATVNAVKLDSSFEDAAVTIDGPGEVVSGTTSDFTVSIATSRDLTYKILVYYDGIKMLDREEYGDFEFSFVKTITEGDHHIEAVLEVDDHFAENNRFTKVVVGQRKPKLLFSGQTNGPFHRMLREIYDVDTAGLDKLPGDFDVAVINNMLSSELNSHVNRIDDFLSQGKGVLVIGGKKSFDQGNYKNSRFETLLPVATGAGKKMPDEQVNIVIAVDISKSTGRYFSRSRGETTVDVEKALAISILDSLDPSDYLSVVAFNNKPFVLYPLGPITDKTAMKSQIASLQNGGGTVVLAGLQAAYKQLAGARGSKNVIVISDGVTLSSQDTLSFARLINEEDGIKIYTVGVGRGTNAPFLRGLAGAGGTNMYFEPDQTERFQILFGDQSDETAPKNLVEILNHNHFITQNLLLTAGITGYNYVRPKAAAMLLTATSEGHPIHTVWRYGLGRVGVQATDDGSKWASGLYQGNASLMELRLINWLAGDIARNEDLAVKTRSVIVGKENTVYLYSSSDPVQEGFTFSKLDENLYKTVVSPTEAGFFTLLDQDIAAHYAPEYEHVGPNSDFYSMIKAAGGSVFSPTAIEEIVDSVQQASKRTTLAKSYLRFIPITLAVIIFLFEIAVRRRKIR